MVGYDGNFVNQLEHHHQCPCCMLALRDPLQTECGHRICRECYEDLQHKFGKTGEIICPVDNSIVLPDQVFPDMYAKREVLNLQTYCMYRQSGCQWQGALQHYEEHIITCKYEDIRCPNECGKRLAKHLMEKHLQQSCPLRPVQCEYCNLTMPFGDIQAHYDTCQYYPVDCRFNCGALKMPRNLLQQHHEFECPNAVGACAYSFCGCDFRGTKDDVTDHLQKEVLEHLRLAAKHAGHMDAKNNELQRKLDVEAKRAGNLEKEVREQGNELSRINQVFAALQNNLDSIERDIGDVRRSGETTKESLSVLQKRFRPNMMIDIDNLKEQARLLEAKVNRAVQKSNNVQVTHMNLSGASSLPVASAGTTDTEAEKRIEKLENQLALQDVQIAELNLKLQLLESTAYDGKLLWKIDNFHKRKQDAVMGKSPSLYSPPFYTSRFGYKMCARIYLNGDGQGKGTHISLFFVVMRGEYDSLLEWPFPCKITLKLLAQEGSSHIVEAFRPDPNSSSFRKPSGEMNIASGVPLFANQQKVMSGSYVKKDCIFVQVIVDTGILANSLHF